jgi:hypothetical protein
VISSQDCKHAGNEILTLPYHPGSRKLHLKIGKILRYKREISMSSKPSEQMMDLLQELALLKELDGAHERGPKSNEKIAEFDRRQRRREEIGDQIKALGKSPA